MNPKKETENWVKVLLGTMETRPSEEAKSLMKKMVLMFKKRKKEKILEAIFKKAVKLYLERQKVELIFARKQSQPLISSIGKIIKKEFGPSKKTEIKIDPLILGGFRIKSHNLLIKASLKDFLNELRTVYAGN